MLSPATARRRILPRWLRWLVVCQGLMLGAAGVCFLLSLGTPAWWRQVAPDARTTELGEQVENAVVSQLSLARPADPAATNGYKSREWSVSISAEDADAWLATRLKQWVAHNGARWPEQLLGAQVAFVPGGVKLGMQLAGGRVVSIEVSPTVHADGSLWLEPQRASVGSLPVPVGLVMGELRQSVAGKSAGPDGRGAAEQWIDAVSGARALTVEPVVKLEDGRLVRLLDLSAKKDRVEVTCRTEKR
jgi:hypothetical protein